MFNKEDGTEKNEVQGYSRRDFLKATALIGGGIAASSALAACSPSEGETGNANNLSTEDTAWDKVVDVLAIGTSGAAYGALSAKDAGAESVLLIDKGVIFGGTTSFSGGGHWVPCNHIMAEMGIEDSREDALAYIDYLACGQSSPEVQASYVDNSLAFVDWTMEKWGYVWELLMFGTSQDYAPDDIVGVRPNGRSISINDVETIKNVTGEDIEHSFLVAAAEFKALRYLCEENGIEIMMQTAGKKLYKNEAGEVVGALIEDSSGKEIKVGVNNGVILGTGGFDFNTEMVKSFLHYPIYTSAMLDTCTGDGQRMGMEIGANLANMSSVFGATTFMPVGEAPTDWSVMSDPSLGYNQTSGVRGMPNSITVNKLGQRIGNESGPYGNFFHALEAWSTTTLKPTNIPSYIIVDSNFVENYTFKSPDGIFAPLELGQVPDNFTKADTLEELANTLGIDYAGLTATLDVFNPNAKEGIDPVWHRGENTYDQVNNGDTSGTRTDLVNNCLGPIEKGPFYAAPIWPGTLGTAGGLKTNGKAQVLDLYDQPIPRLYACGCTAASPFGPAYPGGGSPVGSTCTFGYVAGRAAMGAEVK